MDGILFDIYIIRVVGLYTYFKYTKMGVAMGCDATFWEAYKAKIRL